MSIVIFICFFAIAEPFRTLPALSTVLYASSSIGIVAIVLLAIFAPVLWSDDAAKLDLLNVSQGASRAHPLGTDALGRDILYRLLVATRLTVSLAVLAAGFGALIGIPLGAVPALVGGRIGRLTSGFINLTVAFPALLQVQLGQPETVHSRSNRVQPLAGGGTGVGLGDQ